MEVIEARMRRAIEEAQYMDSYDYLIVNDDLDVCMEDMHQVIQAEHKKVNHCQKMIADIRKELQEL